jgi:hypothetical protein
MHLKFFFRFWPETSQAKIAYFVYGANAPSYTRNVRLRSARKSSSRTSKFNLSTLSLTLLHLPPVALLRHSSNIPSRVFSIESEPSLSAFKKLCSQESFQQEYPLSSEVLSNVPIYNLAQLDTSDEGLHARLQAEWHHILLAGPGVVVLKNMYLDKQLIEKVNSVYSGIIESEKQAARKGDHFASSSANDRI